MTKVILKGHIIVPDADINAVKRELATHIALTQQEAGCLVFNVAQDATHVNRFDVYEEFTNRDTFAKHQDRVRDSQWGTTTVNVERYYEITDID